MFYIIYKRKKRNLDKNKIISDFYTSRKFNETLSKLCKNKDHIDDLKQEVIMILLEKDDNVIIDLAKGNLLLFYTIGIIRNQYHSNTSDFWKKFRNTHNEIIDDIYLELSDIDYETLLTSKIEKYLLTEIDWFSAHIFKCYYFTKVDKESGKILKPLSLRKIQDLHRWNGLKIDYNKISKIVKITMEDLKNKLKKDGYIIEHDGKLRINSENLFDGLDYC
jgi:hypothetical protein